MQVLFCNFCEIFFGLGCGGGDGAAKGADAGGGTNVCIECIGHSAAFVCSSRTRGRVRLAHTKTAECPLQSTQHY